MRFSPIRTEPRRTPMPRSSEGDDLPLFRDVPHELPPVSVLPWRSTPADAWSEVETPSTAAIERHSPDLVRRNLEFLRAVELHGKEAMSSEVQRFHEGHEELVRRLVRWRADGGSVQASLAMEALRELSDLRREILTGLDPGVLRKVMAAEPRVRVHDREVEWVIGVAGFELAEERGELVAIELPTDLERLAPPGFIGPDDVDLLIMSHLERMKAEQERRRLPSRSGLNTLLGGLPAEWLDAVWEALDLPPERPPHRKERERRIAEHLTEDGALEQVIAEGLSDEECRLLTYLLKQGGQASAGAVVERFGSDEGDGWFWNEEPPTSVLGRVRLHGLAFVGAAPDASGTRLVVVPRELRAGLEGALAVAGEG